MRSKAHIKGHPLHPILICFPFAFLFATMLFDVLGRLTGNQIFWTTAYSTNSSGVLSALVAAVPGFIDYIYVVPPRSSAKKRAIYHMCMNLGATALFALAWVVRDISQSPSNLMLLIEIGGIVCLSIGGWLGGTLVYRNQIGIDHRYAHAGKWGELTTPEGKGRIAIGRHSEMKPNQMKLLRAGDTRVVIGKTEDGFVAFQDHCTHKGGSLAGGTMACGTVTCPWHGSQFNVHSGSVYSGPAKESIQTFPVEDVDGELFVMIDSNNGQSAREELKRVENA